MSGEDEKFLVRALGSLPVQAGATALAAWVGTPAAALLPVLSASIPQSRFQKKVKAHLSSLEKELQHHAEEINALHDEQYKLLSDVISLSFETINDKKLEYLKAATINCLTFEYSHDFEVSVLGRLIRDLSGEEIYFLTLVRDSVNGALLADRVGRDQEGYFVVVESHCSDSLIIHSLINSHLLEPQGRIRSGQPYVLSLWAKRLLELVCPIQASA